jgi:hypothetical protein
MLLAACKPSPDDLVFVMGALVDAKANPLVGREVILRRKASPVCFDRLRLRPQDAEDAVTFSYVDTTRTDEQGRFLFEQLLAETRAYARDVGQLFGCFEVSVNGQSAWMRFDHSGSDVQLPGLLLWEQPLPIRYNVQSDTLRAVNVPARGALPGVLDYPDTKDARPIGRWDVVRLTTDQGLAWTQTLQTAAAQTALIRREVFEDFSNVRATVEMSGLGTVPGGSAFQPEDTYLLSTASSAPRAMPSETRIPATRGAACTEGAQCPWTDGKLEPVAVLRGAGSPAGMKTVEITLPNPKILSSVVVRNVTLQEFLVEPGGGADLWLEGFNELERTWVRLGFVGRYDSERDHYSPVFGDGQFFVGDLNLRRVPVKSIRLVVDPGSTAVFRWLGELSAFE